MKTIVIRISTNCLAICRVTGVYLGDDIFRSVTAAISKSRPNDYDFQSWSSLLISGLHRMFTDNGNQHDLLEMHGRSAHGWYQAGCEIVLLSFGYATIECSQLGTIHVYSRDNDQGCIPVASVHNVAQELQHATIEESRLQPFENRPQAEIAKQLLYASPEVVPHLASMNRDEFINSIAHCATRSIGFYPEMEGGKLSYCKHLPVPEYGKFSMSEHGSTVLFFPTVAEFMQYEG
jgi:hypothetical protein